MKTQQLALLGMASVSAASCRDTDRHRSSLVSIDGDFHHGGGSPLDEKSVLQIGDTAFTDGHIGNRDVITSPVEPADANLAAWSAAWV